jgi:hypothetical protein
MKDPQKLRHEARGFLDKAKTTSDRAVRRVLLERALRLAQQAGMIEQAAEMPAVAAEGGEDSIDKSTQARGAGRRRA